MTQDGYTTRGGIRVHRSVDRIAVRDAVEPLLDGLDSRRGALLTSSYEYPGRYTRWDMGFVDPPLEIERTDDLRADVATITRILAKRFERYISAAPTDWHMFQPAWDGEPAVANAPAVAVGSTP